MAAAKLKLSVLPWELAICRLEKGVKIPAWATERPSFVSITITNEELSIVCDGGSIPPDVPASRGWRAFKVEGPLDLSMTGLISSMTGPLAASGISVFSVSTYDTDYLLIKSEMFDEAVRILSGFFEVKL